MQHKILLGDKELTYTLRKKRGTRRVSLSVNCDAEVSVTAPYFFSVYLLEKFIKEKSDWLWKKIEYRKQNPVNKISCSHKTYLLHKSRALRLVRVKLAEFNKFYNFSYRKVCIKNQKSCWGSCSGRGTLSFSYRLAFVPERLAEYVVVHELCHLKEMNHSSRFWALVAQTIPDFKQRRTELKSFVSR